jgi:hypothetical protein
MYLAPEMLRGAADAVPATDQWALGLLAFRALAGTEYFGHARGFPALVLAIANDPMVAPSERAPSLPAAFDAWFLRSCARDPAARFPDVPAQVAALAAALGNPAPVPIAPFARSGPTGAVRPAIDPAVAPTQSAPRPAASRRARTRLVLLATSVAWAVGALAAVSWLERHPRAKSVAVASPAPPPPAAAPPPTAVAAVPAPTVSPPVRPATEPALHEEPPPAPSPPPPLAPSPPVAVKEKRAHHRHAETPAPAAPPLRAVAAVPAASPLRAEAAVPAASSARAEAAVPAASPARPAVEPARGKAKGASCQRSAECASGLCAAETCL